MRILRCLVVAACSALVVTTVPSVAVASTGSQGVTMYLAPHDRAALDALAHSTGLSWAERQAELAQLRPTAADRQSVSDELSALGLHVTSSHGWTVTARGAAGRIGALFGSARAQNPHSKVQHALPTVPAALRAHVTAAYGGDDDRPVATRLDWTSSSTPNANPGLNGTQLRSTYGVTAPSSNSTSAIVATLQFGTWNSNNLNYYASAIGHPLTSGQYTAIAVDGGPSASDTGNADEIALDQESLLGIAPYARQRAYFAPSQLSGTDTYLDALYHVGDDAAAASVGNHIVALSTSYGFCESDLSTSAAATNAYEDALAYLLASGVTVFAASGDNGSACNNGSGFAANTVTYPASSPSTVAVGGTSLWSSSPAVETAWGCGATSGCTTPSTTCTTGTGCAAGGISTQFNRPVWQSKQTVSTTHRMVPDIAALADPSTGFGIFVTCPGGGTCIGPVGGTSLASPLSAGMLADELIRLNHPYGVGDIHSALYGAPSADFRDINDGASNGSYTSGPGYDLLTGLGVPKWDTIASRLLGNLGEIAAVTGTGHNAAVWRNGVISSLGGYVITPTSTFSRHGIDYFVALAASRLPYIRTMSANWARLTSSGSCYDVQAGLSGSILTVTCLGANNAPLVAQANLSDNALPTLGGWQSLGGSVIGAPAIAEIHGVLTLLGTGLAHYAYYNQQVVSSTGAVSWSGWHRLPYTCLTRPAVATYGALTAIACIQTDNAMHASWFTGNSWPSSLTNYGTGVTQTAGIAIAPSGRVTGWARASNGHLYEKQLSAPTSGWWDRGSGLLYGPTATETTYVPPVTTTLPATTSTTLQASTTTPTTGQSVTYAAAVTSGGAAVTTGAVTFRDVQTGVTLGTKTLDSTGHATLTKSYSLTGSHQIIAIYSGTSAYAASVSSQVNLTVS